ncbi:MAG: MFS transporter, partial [Streptomycetaceae bacterium]|nr:MFS transporter [Streptomycetaceae bacterium]
MTASPPPLWDREFRLLFAAHATSVTGTAVTAVALPLTALTTLGAGVFDAALLAAAGQVPLLLLALPCGALVDRARSKKAVMITCELVCAVAVGSVPLAAAAGVLALPQLYGVAFTLAAGSVVFQAAAGAFTPDLLGGERLVAGNGAMGMAGSVADVAGAPLAGALVAAAGAARALAADAVSYLAAALLLAHVR